MSTLYSLLEMPSTAKLFSAYASVTATIMLIKSIFNEIIPHEFQSYVASLFNYIFSRPSSDCTLIIDQDCGMTRNQIYEAAETYLPTKIAPSIERLRVGKVPKENTLRVEIEAGQEIIDTFDKVQLKWKFVSTKDSDSHNEKRYYELTFPKKFREEVLNTYLSHVVDMSKSIKQNKRAVKLYSLDISSYEDGRDYWGSTALDHPSTFETLAMDSDLKKLIIEDLDRFLTRKDFYKRVGRAWKRGYLLYGPPGTGKSSLIAAMANYLKFDIFDLELNSVYSDSQLRRLLVDTSNRSILVIEDIDCSRAAQDRENNDSNPDTKFTLSGLLNFIDGLWSSFGDERIIVFTTNHKDRIDPALLRPGRMDMHIHMSYCTFEPFKILANNYLGIDGHHPHFGEIEKLLVDVKVTPAEVAEELMRSEDANVALGGVIKLLQDKKKKAENGVENGNGSELKVAGSDQGKETIES